YPTGASIDVTTSSDDAVSHVGETLLFLDGTTAVPPGQPLTNLAAGPHSLTLQATDVAGNTATSVVQFQVLAPAEVSVHGGGTAHGGGRHVEIHLWARQSPSGAAAGELCCADSRACLRIRSGHILSVAHTPTGAV